MCGRFYLYTLPEDIAAQLGAALPPDLDWARPRYNIAPTQDILIVRASRDDDHREIRLARWGLVPHWAEDISIGARLINARSESAQTKPAFKNAFARRRCLIPANGFYEWQPTAGGPKRPMRAQRPDGALLTMAGLWETWRDPKDPEIKLRSAAILTTDANKTLAPIHHRMPVFLEGAARDRWLDPSADPDALRGILAAAPDDLLETTEVSRRINRPENDDPTLLDPVETSPDPGLLF
ncbi:MAG: SOS response-associated peptidase [Phycisphaerales bacterium JB039]